MLPIDPGQLWDGEPHYVTRTPLKSLKISTDHQRSRPEFRQDTGRFVKNPRARRSHRPGRGMCESGPPRGTFGPRGGEGQTDPPRLGPGPLGTRVHSGAREPLEVDLGTAGAWRGATPQTHPHLHSATDSTPSLARLGAPGKGVQLPRPPRCVWEGVSGEAFRTRWRIPAHKPGG